jgi:hypothetical protein
VEWVYYCASIYKKSDKTYCSNYYRGISLLSTSHKTSSNILLSRLTPYVDEIIGDHQCGYRQNRSTTDQILCIRQILENKWEYSGTVHQLFIDFKKAYDSVSHWIQYTSATAVIGSIKLYLNIWISVVMSVYVNTDWLISWSKWADTRTCFIIIAFQLYLRIRHLGGPRKTKRG